MKIVESFRELANISRKLAEIIEKDMEKKREGLEKIKEIHMEVKNRGRMGTS